MRFCIVPGIGIFSSLVNEVALSLSLPACVRACVCLCVCVLLGSMGWSVIVTFLVIVTCLFIKTLQKALVLNIHRLQF